MSPLDLLIIFVYLAGVIAAGAWFGRRQKTTAHYFLADRSVPWWAIGASIVATETSTVSLISVPGIAYARGGNFTFLQLVFGYLLGRIVISLIFIPQYFTGKLLTVYQLLQQRFGLRIKALSASLFVVMRTIADGVRLLLTAIVVAAVYRAFQPGEGDMAFTIAASIVALGLVMIVFTFFGGIEAVVWIEVVQLLIYLAGAIGAAWVLAAKIPGGLAAAIDLGAAHGKFQLFDFALDFTRSYVFWAGAIGGCFLTMSTHGTDQFMVQRYLCTDKPRSASLALLTSGAVILAQFIGFLFIGVLLFAFYRPDQIATYASGSPAAPFTASDQVFPAFITQHLPTGLSGLVVAAILAAAMSSSLSAIASTAMADLYQPLAPNRTDRHYLNVSRFLIIVAGAAQIGVALAMQGENRTALDSALSIASLINGPILGVFLLSTLRRGAEGSAFAGMTAGLAVVLWLRFGTAVAWPWFTVVGSVTTVVVGWLFTIRPEARGQRPEKAVIALLLLASGLWPLASCTTSRPHVNDLSIEEKVGQLIIPAVTGVFMNERSPAYEAAVREVTEHHAGGLLLNVSDVYETAWVVGRLQRIARVPLLVSADLESGIGMRFNDTTQWPWAMAIGATGDPEYAEKLGRVVGREARAVGVNHIFAPVADVNNNPDNPVINVRSFGEDPETVGRFVAAFIRGVQSEGVLATAKHFPGHGDTAADSHRSLPILDVSRERLDRLELVPFRAAIDAGVDSIMVAHISLPQIDRSPLPPAAAPLENVYSTDEGEMAANATTPSSLSRNVIDLLRRDLRFDRLVVTDAIEMGALSDHFSPGEASIRAIEAGADQVAKPYETDEVFDALVGAVKSGRISRQRLDEAVGRVLAAKRRIAQRRPAPLETIFREVDRPEHRALAEEIAANAITLVRLEEGALPLGRDARVAILVVGDRPEASTPLRELESQIRARVARRPIVEMIDRATPPDEVAKALDATRDAAVVLVAFTVRTRSGAGPSAIPDHAKQLLSEIEARGQRTIAISFGNPYLLRDVPGMKTYIAAYGVQPVMQKAAARALFGEAPIGGRLPVSIPGIAARGAGIERCPLSVDRCP